MIALPHILIIEDNEDDYEATERSFRQAHFVNPISWCRSGQEALDFLQRGHRPADLILLDLNLPGMGGQQVLQTIKADPSLKSIPIIIMTAISDSRDVELSHELGAATYVEKPVDFRGLAQAIRTMADPWFGIALLPQTNDQKGRNS
jgi:two-component system, response regulator